MNKYSQRNSKWKDVKGYENLYQVSNDGLVKSFHGDKPRILKQSLDSHGYKMVTLYKNGQYYNIGVHKLVAWTFIDNLEFKPQTNHKNGIKTDNNVNNLEWVSAKENVNHAFKNGLCKSWLRGMLGSKHPRAKKILQYTLNKKFIKKFGSIADATRITNVDGGDICKVAKYKKKQAGGYFWSYIRI